MPKGNRGSRGKSKGKRQPLGLDIKMIRVPRGLGREVVKKVLLQAAESNAAELPDGWIVQLGWRNTPKQAWRYDEFTNAMLDSSQGGRGWKKMVISYIRGL